MLNKTGVPTAEDIAGVAPSPERLQKGPVAVIECFQNIPCNPCYTSCKRGAIKELTDINDRPVLDFDKCNGCGTCISNCPGLAITVVDTSRPGDTATVRLPYEFLPLPEEGSWVTALNREGREVCAAKVVKVINSKVMDRTPTVTLEVPKEYAMSVRFFKMKETAGDDEYLCRCEEITRGEVRALIEKGCTSVDEIKRLSRAGMGPCQGRTCRQLIMQEIAAMTGVKPADQPMSTFRPPVKPIKMGMLLDSEDNTNEKNG